MWYWVRQGFLKYNSKTTIDKRKNDKFYYIKIYNFCIFGKTLIREWKKDKVTHLEKIFATYISDIGLIFQLYKELSKYNNKKTNTHPKMDKRHEHTLPQKIYR